MLFCVSPDIASVSNLSEKGEKTGTLGRIWGELSTLGRTSGELCQGEFRVFSHLSPVVDNQNRAGDSHAERYEK